MCYKYSSDKKNFANAQSACKADGGRLAEPQSTAEQKDAYSVLSPVETTFVGLTDSATEGKYVELVNHLYLA